MNLTIDESSRKVQQFTCSCCATEAERTWANVYDGDSAFAVYFASCYQHRGEHEVFIDAILGSWNSDDFADHVTFGCRVGPIDDSPDPAATLVDGGAAAPDSPIFGRKLSLNEGLAHARLDDFWAVIDTIMQSDQLVAGHLYGVPAEAGTPPIQPGGI